MPSDARVLGSENQGARPEGADEVRWPLPYRLQLPKQQHGQQSLQSFGFDSSKVAKKCWWSHRLYRGPNNKPVQIQYSKTKEDSEIIASQFLCEDVVGFDMEWPWNDWKKPDLQNKIGLIQVATEEKIALFHIGLHTGKTTNDIIAPSLRALIESPKIGKLGVGILSADFARLRRYFRLDPKGAVELSHMYRLVKFGSWKPELVSTKLVSLARLVEDQLGHPLYKGDVRTSNWSKPLSQDQINYAAADAYAGLMLYRFMDYRRHKMRPVPPLPIHAETYLGFKLSGVVPLRLQGQAEDGTILTSERFFGVPMADSARSNKGNNKTAVSKTKSALPNIPRELTDPAAQALYNELFMCRSRLAEAANKPVFQVAPNTVLVALALQRPLNVDQLLVVKGIGAKQQEKYGAVWLEIISQSSNLITRATGIHTSEPTKNAQRLEVQRPKTPTRDTKRGRITGEESGDSSPAFATPPHRTPTLHTGLSFTIAETTIDKGSASDYYVSDDSLPSLDLECSATHVTPQLKRKRTESASHGGTRTASQLLRQMTRTHNDGRLSPTSGHEEVLTLPSTHSLSARIPDAPLSPHSKIARNKLLAFSRLVSRKMSRSSDAPPLVMDRTLDLIVINAPRTLEELESIPGIDTFILACQKTNTDLLKNVIKFAPVRTRAK
jgi:ribonuclease D